MHERTKATLSELEAAKWFDAVGKPVEPGVITVSSWEEAIIYTSAPEWKELIMAQSDWLSSQLFSLSPEYLDKWNDIVDEIEPVALNLVARKICKVVKDNHLPSVFNYLIGCQIFGLLMEAEYADLVAPRFFAGLSYWYSHGHYPCGYERDFPDMTLIVY